MSTHEILIAARARIEKPERWTQARYYGVHEGGKVTIPLPREAPDCFCATAAIAEAMDVSINEAEKSSAFHQLQIVCGMSVHMFNDASTHAEVLAAFDRAIEATKP